MIVRTWSGRVPQQHAEGFRSHVAATSVAEFRAQPACVDVALWRRIEREWVVFTFVSTWRDMDSIRAYAGPDPARAVHYPGDEAFGLVPDAMVTHHELIEPV